MIRMTRAVHRKGKTRQYSIHIPLTEIDIGDFNSLDLDTMSVRDLKALRIHLEDLLSEILCTEPADRRSIEYRFWSHRLFRVESFLAGVQDLLGRLGNTAAKGPLCNAFRYLPVA